MKDNQLAYRISVTQIYNIYTFFYFFSTFLTKKYLSSIVLVYFIFHKIVLLRVRQ